MISHETNSGDRFEHRTSNIAAQSNRSPRSVTKIVFANGWDFALSTGRQAAKRSVHQRGRVPAIPSSNAIPAPSIPKASRRGTCCCGTVRHQTNRTTTAAIPSDARNRLLLLAMVRSSPCHVDNLRRIVILHQNTTASAKIVHDMRFSDCQQQLLRFAGYTPYNRLVFFAAGANIRARLCAKSKLSRGTCTVRGHQADRENPYYWRYAWHILFANDLGGQRNDCVSHPAQPVNRSSSRMVAARIRIDAGQSRAQRLAATAYFQPVGIGQFCRSRIVAQELMDGAD